ncbi:MAG TPA: glycosyltransferase, partial [Flavobacterium sp.]|nr:glycosyltransferase [Flavobacterium sp.]
EAGIEYGGWLPNYKVPEVFAKYKMTVHVPRGPYVKMLPGIPTIRPFEALACGIPLISAPWNDAENLFTDGDYLVASNGKEMKAMMRIILDEKGVAEVLAENGRRTIMQRHTCAHRVDELEQIMTELGFQETSIYPLQNKIVEL